MILDLLTSPQGELPTHVKVLFYIEQEDGTFEVESVWAVAEGAGYRLDNIPFFARGVAWGDVVAAEMEPDGSLRHTGLIAASGHGTIRVLLNSPADVQRVRDELLSMGCSSERWRTSLIAVDVPSNVPYGEVRSYLELGERTGLFEYEEGCLAQP